jgi:hypothetical protein
LISYINKSDCLRGGRLAPSFYFAFGNGIRDK